MNLSPDIQYVTLNSVGTATGVVVVIDVCRAFTTAAFAFAAGAERIFLVGTVEEALAFKAATPGSLVMGEVSGKPVSGFDFWNSPSQFDEVDLSGKTLIQRTTAGTQGVVLATQASQIWASSLVVAKSTVKALQSIHPDRVTFVLTGVHQGDLRAGREDEACADYLSALLRGYDPAPDRFLAWAKVRESRLEDAPPELSRQFQSDITLCARPNLFNFAMAVRRDKGRLILERMEA